MIKQDFPTPESPISNILYSISYSALEQNSGCFLNAILPPNENISFPSSFDFSFEEVPEENKEDKKFENISLQIFYQFQIIYF
mmetsp:Transcript_42849/g.65802  ORF Transcript_42849/g.65802 Transcript_42849/m.65802 type:complete len:83 (-) Transcript_42849:31-279(-)